MIIGYPEAQRRFNEKFRKFIDELERRQPLLERIFVRTEANKVGLADRYIFFLGAAAYQDFQEILVLVGNGLAVGGLKILRGLYEKVLTATYLSKFPDEANDFADYDAVHKYKLLSRVPQEVRKQMLSPEAVEGIESKYQQVKTRFTKKLCDCGKTGLQSSWTMLDSYSMALKTEGSLKEVYGPAFLFPTYHLHTTALDVIGRVDANSGELSTKPDAAAQYSRDVLIQAHLLFYSMAALLNKHFEIGLDREVEEAVQGYNSCWEPEN